MTGLGVKAIRLSLGLTQAEFAKELRMSQALISDVENNRRSVTLDLRIRVAQKYGVGPDIMDAIAAAKDSIQLA